MSPNRAAVDSSRENPPITGLVSRLRERVYVTFTGLAVLLALGQHLEGMTPLGVATALLIGAVGATLAGFVSDSIAHLAVSGSLPSSAEMRHLVGVALGALGSVVVPLILLAASGLGIINLDLAVQLSVGALALALGAVAYIAVHRSNLPAWKKFTVFVAELAIAGLVIAVQLLAHA